MKKDELIKVRLTGEQKRKLERSAASYDLTLSAFIRAVALQGHQSITIRPERAR